jgi:hypothetical protein
MGYNFCDKKTLNGWTHRVEAPFPWEKTLQWTEFLWKKNSFLNILGEKYFNGLTFQGKTLQWFDFLRWKTWQWFEFRNREVSYFCKNYTEIAPLEKCPNHVRKTCKAKHIKVSWKINWRLSCMINEGKKKKTRFFPVVHSWINVQ